LFKFWNATASSTPPDLFIAQLQLMEVPE